MLGNLILLNGFNIFCKILYEIFTLLLFILGSKVVEVSATDMDNENTDVRSGTAQQSSR